MITINEQRTIREIHSNPDISLRMIVEKVGLGGVASASHIVNSLESKGYLEKIGVATNKKYRLTQKAITLEDVINMKVDDLTTKKVSSITNNGMYPTGGQFTTSDKVEAFQNFSSSNFPNSTGPDESGKAFREILSASFTRIMNSPTGIQKYGDVIMLSIILTTIVLPICHFVLQDQWISGFVTISLFLLIAIILNKK